MSTEKSSISFIGLYPEDWITGCRLLSPMAEWAYLQICLEIWDTGKPIDQRRMPRLLMRAGDTYQSLIDELLDEGKIEADRHGRISNHRAMAAHRLAANLHEKRKKSAKKAAESRWNSSGEKAPEISDEDAPRNAPRNAPRTLHAMQTKTKTKTKESLTTLPPKSPPEKTGIQQVDFLSPIPDEAWAKFEQHRRELGKPLTKVGTNRARKKLERIIAETGQDPAAIIQQSIDQVWLGLFELKHKPGEKPSGWGWINE